VQASLTVEVERDPEDVVPHLTHVVRACSALHAPTVSGARWVYTVKCIHRAGDMLSHFTGASHRCGSDCRAQLRTAVSSSRGIITSSSPVVRHHVRT
jgi:hypothetical protein